jgi:hypothetical protein
MRKSVDKQGAPPPVTVKAPLPLLRILPLMGLPIAEKPANHFEFKGVQFFPQRTLPATGAREESSPPLFPALFSYWNPMAFSTRNFGCLLNPLPVAS